MATITTSTRSSALLVLLSNILPHKAHANALTKLKQDRLVDDAIATLAHDAQFTSVGMYWTLRDSANFWQEEKALRPMSSSTKPDVVKAWDMIAAKQVDFEALRAEMLLGSKSKREVANQLYQCVNTHACQPGLALTLATLHHRALIGSTSVVAIAHGMANGANAWLLSKTTGDYDRRLALSKRKDDNPKHALNVIANMGMPRAFQFRDFWLETLSSPQVLAELEGLVEVSYLKELRTEARWAHIAYVAGEKERRSGHRVQT